MKAFSLSSYKFHVLGGFTMKKIVKLASVAAGLAMFTAPVAKVSAATTSDYSLTSSDKISKENIVPVASKGNETLRQIAKNNHIDLSVLEKLNDGIDPDVPIQNGTPLFLPFNVKDISDYNSGEIDDDANPDQFDPEDDLTRSGFGQKPVGNPYANVPASIKKKYYNTLSKSERSAKNWIAFNESRYDYTVWNNNHTCYGRFQLTKSYLNGNYSKTNQEKTAERYVHNRYGSWKKAKAFWKQNGWY